MAERCLLHKNKLNLLKWWLSSRGYEIQDTKSIYEVLRANNGEDTVIIFKQNGAKEHLTVQNKDYKLIRQFIQETRKKPTNYDRIRNMSVEALARFLAEHIDHYRAPYEVKEIYANAIDNKTGKGVIWIEAFKRWLESEVKENAR